MGTDSLPSFIEQVTGDSHLRVESDLGGGFVRLLSSEAERRQAKQDIRSVEDIVIEMLRNSRDAGAHLIFVSTAREGSLRRLTIIDDGQGIPASVQEAIFEPRVTNKLDTGHMDRWGMHGRGMALFSIRENTVEARVAASAPGLGAALTVAADTSVLPERTEQSALPHFALSEEGRPVMRGPRNINRMVAEFAWEERQSCQVFLGSPNEIAATLVVRGRAALDATAAASLGAGNHEGVPLCLRSALCDTPAALAQQAALLGLEMSERSARRILDGQIAPAPPFLARLDLPGTQATGATASSASDAAVLPADARGLKVDAGDLQAFASRLADAWRPLARAYFLEEGVEPQVRVGKDGIRVFFPAVKER